MPLARWIIVILHTDDGVFAYGPWADEGEARAIADNIRAHDGEYRAVLVVPLRPRLGA